MRLLYGVNFTNVDLEQQRSYRLKGLQKELEQKKAAVRATEKAHLPESYDEAMDDLIEFQKQLQSERGALLSTSVRGPSLRLSQPQLGPFGQL